MKIIKNCLPNYVVDICCAEFKKRQSQEKTWSINENFWEAGLLESIPGVCSQQYIEGQLKEKLEEELSEHLPEYDEILFQFYNWHRLSGIGIHDDGGWGWGATIYLNDDWNINWGGIFMWDDGGETLKALNPVYNTLIINAPTPQKHLVTLISPLAPQTRKTIQIWGGKHDRKQSHKTFGQKY